MHAVMLFAHFSELFFIIFIIIASVIAIAIFKTSCANFDMICLFVLNERAVTKKRYIHLHFLESILQQSIICNEKNISFLK